MSRAAAVSISIVALSLVACRPPPAPRRSEVDLVTTAEKSGWITTGRYDEAVRLCRDLARVYPAAARCDRYGVTPEGRDMVYLVVSQDGVVTFMWKQDGKLLLRRNVNTANPNMVGA